MNFVKLVEKFNGADIGYHESNVYPDNGEGRVGKAGLDKNLSLAEIMDIAHRMENKPNIIIKGGKNAKWYLKRYPKEKINGGIDKSKWRDTSRCIMWVVEWD